MRVVAPAAARRTENISKSEEISQDVAEVRKNLWINTAETLHAGMAEPVVARAFVRVAQNAVGFGSLLKFFFSGIVSRIFIRMVLLSKLSIRALNVLSGSFWGYT